MGGQGQGGGFQRQKTLSRHGLFAVAVAAAGRRQHQQAGALHAQQRHLTTHLLEPALGIAPAELLADLPRQLTAPGVTLGDDQSDAFQFGGAEGPAAEARRSAGLRRAHGARAREREIPGGQGATACGGCRNPGYQPRNTSSSLLSSRAWTCSSKCTPRCGLTPRNLPLSRRTLNSNKGTKS